MKVAETGPDTLICALPRDAGVRSVVARWSVREWADDFPDDTEQTYLDLYELGDRDPDALPVVLVALGHGGATPVGTVSLVDDDELPDAAEAGPWLAAMFVDQLHRGAGLGAALVRAAEAEATRLGIDELFLYTADAAAWYEALGWTRLRSAAFGEREVTVMRRRLAPRAHAPSSDSRRNPRRGDAP